MSSIAFAVKARTRTFPLVTPVIAFAFVVAFIAATMVTFESNLKYVPVFFGLTVLAEAFPAPVGKVAGHTSLSVVAIVPAALILGWQYAALIALASVLLAEAVRHKGPIKALYNGSMFSLAAAAAGLVGSQFDGVAAVLTATGVYYVVNISLLVGVITLSSSETGIWKSYVGATAPQLLILGSLAAIFAELWMSRPWLIVLMIGPIAAIVAHQRMMHKVMEKMRELDLEKDDFISYASHELRTPIAVISGAAQTIRQRKLDPPTKAQLDELVYDNAVRLSKLTDQLLDMNRISKGNPNSRTIYLAEYANDLVRRLGLEGRVTIDCGGTVVTDPDMLDRVIGNLVTNAVAYGAEPISITGHDGNISIADCGNGVPEEFRERMFKRFTRASLTANKSANGAGLGLALAASYAEVLGGSMAYEDNQPHGARFVVSVPNLK